jgi:hypothetical protein
VVESLEKAMHHSRQLKLEKTTSVIGINELDPLWTGESCASDNPCCSFNNPPYFRVQLPAAKI